MDKKQLVLIAITAAMSVAARELFTWIVSIIKNQAAKESTREKLKKIVTPKVMGTAWGAIWISVCIFFIAKNMKPTAPPTRGDILLIALWTSSAFMNLTLILNLLGGD